MLAIYIDAGHDTNGNPRRGWIIADSSGQFVDFVDEGYEGQSALLRDYHRVPETQRIVVKPSVYRDLKKQSRR
jgi:hypothetical protein